MKSMLGLLRRDRRQARPFLARHLGDSGLCGPEKKQGWKTQADQRQNDWLGVQFIRPEEHCKVPFCAQLVPEIIELENARNSHSFIDKTPVRIAL